MTSSTHVKNIATITALMIISATALSNNLTLLSAAVVYSNIHNLTFQFIKA